MDHSLQTLRRPRLSLGRAIFLKAALTALVATTGHAQPVVMASPDLTVALGGANLTTFDHAVAIDNQLGIVVLEDLGPIPESAEVIAFAERQGGARLMAFDTVVALPGGLVARRGDVVAWNGTAYSHVFDASQHGVPDGVRVDAVSTAPRDALLLSFDTDVSLPGGILAADEDLVRQSGSRFFLVFDGSAAGVDRALDVDAAQDLGGGFLMSFDAAGSVGGIAFQDEDILRHASGVWSIEFDASAADADWGPADLGAVQVPEPVGGAPPLVATLLMIAIARGRRPRLLREARKK